MKERERNRERDSGNRSSWLHMFKVIPSFFFFVVGAAAVVAHFPFQCKFSVTSNSFYACRIVLYTSQFIEDKCLTVSTEWHGKKRAKIESVIWCCNLQWILLPSSAQIIKKNEQQWNGFVCFFFSYSMMFYLIFFRCCCGQFHELKLPFDFVYSHQFHSFYYF